MNRAASRAPSARASRGFSAREPFANCFRLAWNSKFPATFGASLSRRRIGFPSLKPRSNLEIARLPKRSSLPPGAEWVALKLPRLENRKSGRPRRTMFASCRCQAGRCVAAFGAPGRAHGRRSETAGSIRDSRKRDRCRGRGNAAAHCRAADQMKEAAEKSVATAVAAHIERTHQEQQQRMQKELEASVAAMRAEWSREMDQRIADARLQMDSQLAEIESVRGKPILDNRFRANCKPRSRSFKI